MTLALAPLLPRLIGVLALVMGVGAVGCQECVENFDCGLGNQCVEGACVVRPDNGVTVLSPIGPITSDAFDLSLRVQFRGASAKLRVDRANGDRCLPFIPFEQTLPGDADELVTQDITLPGVLSLGEQFRLRVTLDVIGNVTVTDFDFAGVSTGDDVGGFVFAAPIVDDVDVVAAPWLPVVGEVDGNRAAAWIETVGDSAGTTPRRSVAEASASASGFVPLARGPQILWVETGAGDTLRRCGRGLLGGPPRDDGGNLEIALLTEEEDAWLGLSVKVSDPATGEVICDATRKSARCEAVRSAFTPAPQNADIVRVAASDGVVEVAAVPRAISGPVTAWVRVTRAGRHEGFFGPFTVLPRAGQSWVAGRIILQGGQVFALVNVDEVVVGAPW